MKDVDGLVPVSYDISLELYTELELIAQQEGITVSDLVAALLADAFSYTPLVPA
jgi:predicted DNA-binding ribbon-helix-helix protein